MQVEGEISYRSFQREIEAVRKASEVGLMINSTGGDSVAAWNLIEAMKRQVHSCHSHQAGLQFRLRDPASLQVRRVCEGATLMVHSPTSSRVVMPGICASRPRCWTWPPPSIRSFTIAVRPHW